MSVYGAIAAPNSAGRLSPRTYLLPSGKAATVFHVGKDSPALPPAVVRYLHGVFSGVLAEGRTYPQRGPLDERGFKEYFMAADLFLALLDEDAEGLQIGEDGIDAGDKTIEDDLGTPEDSLSKVVLGTYCLCYFTLWLGSSRLLCEG
jgi:hypothetical protein